MAEILRHLNGISAKRIIDHLKMLNFASSLAKLRVQQRDRQHKHSVYQHHPNALRLTGEQALMQKVNYIHLNPVRAGLVEHPDDYLYSSSRQWHRRGLEKEPLMTDQAKMRWRAA
jgi:hypothetical protein